jgi:hypothetical protein
MILEVTRDEISRLTDTDLRTLVAYLAESEVRSIGHSPSAVTWGGHQNASDGGIDVRVTLPIGASIAGYIPRPHTGFQVKAQKMPAGAVRREMVPNGTLLPSIVDLAAGGGAYVIVSSESSTSDRALRERRAAMEEAAKLLPSGVSLTLDFYDAQRIASWVNQYPALVPWVRQRLGYPHSGWRPYEDWSSSPAPLTAEYLIDERARLIGASVEDPAGLSIADAIRLLRKTLLKAKGVVRLVGLSGVGKTRLLQALFDSRIGTEALPPSEVLYADISDSPDPIPQEMLSRLIGMNRRVILVVDNCGIELHRKLAARVATSECLISLITVEYDINDDEPPYTDTFKLEPASEALIEKMVKDHYPGIAEPSRRVIARFSEGNARVALALAETAKHGESLVALKDSELFDRLFFQQKGHNEGLLDASKVCALLYSFDGETLEGRDSELEPLANLAGMSVDKFHKHVADLERRQLVQRRGKWRAILPHALANRLAKRALEDIPYQRIESAILSVSSARMIRSFSHRIGYLHDHDVAVKVAHSWLSDRGLLSQLGRLEASEEKIFENVAPVDPSHTLLFIERAAASGETWFFGEQNENKSAIVRVIRSIAFDANLFLRCSRLLARFALNEVRRSQSTAREVLGSLFSLYLSGTHATTRQRAECIKELLQSGVALENQLGLSLLNEMFKTSHFTSTYSFDFGVRTRDYGFRPRNGDEVRDWYAEAIAICLAYSDTATKLASDVRRLLANHVPDLLQIGMFEEVITLCKAFGREHGWPEGWIGLRTGLRRTSEIPESFRKRLEEVERELRPTDLSSEIRSYALSPEWRAVDIADLDGAEPLEIGEARRRVHQICAELGAALAARPDALDAMVEELLSSNSAKTRELGRGLASGCASIKDCWALLKRAFLKVPLGQRYPQMLAGFLSSAAARSPGELEELLDEILSDVQLHPYFVHWQISGGINQRSVGRIKRALVLHTVPVQGFVELAWGGSHESLNDEQFGVIVRDIAAKAGGGPVACEIVGMRVFGRLSAKQPLTDALRATCRAVLAQIDLEDCAKQDFLLGNVVSAAFEGPDWDAEARRFCSKIVNAINRWKVSAREIDDIVAGLARACPSAVLDMIVDARTVQGEYWLAQSGAADNSRANPLEAIPIGVYMAWAARKPATRFAVLARVMRFSTKDDADGRERWTAAALELIDSAPDPVAVLNTFFARFKLDAWSGSLSATLELRLPLLEALTNHSSPVVSAWTREHLVVFKTDIDRERADEIAEHRGRNESFE